MLEPIVQIWHCGRSFCLNLAISEIEILAACWKLLSESGNFRIFGRDAGPFCVNMALSDSFCPNLATLSQNFPPKIRCMSRTGFLTFCRQNAEFRHSKK
jgi:hypothetical protein